MSKLKRFACSFTHDGQDWYFTVFAKDYQDAKDRVAKMAWATVDGEVYAEIPAMFGWFARALTWVLNRCTSS